MHYEYVCGHNFHSMCMMQAKGLAIELYRWAGAAIRPTLEKNLKPVQVHTYFSLLNYNKICK